jgi:hypothetical protein
MLKYILAAKALGSFRKFRNDGLQQAVLIEKWLIS